MADETVVKSLAELKAENLAEETAAIAAEKAAEEAEDAAAESADLDPPDTLPGGDDTLTGEDTIPAETAAQAEDWLKPDEGDEAIAASLKFTDGDVAKLRRKMQGRLVEKEGEIERLRRELSEAKQAKATVVPDSTAPDRDKYEDEAAYQVALTEWAVDQRLTKQNQAAQQAELTRRQEEMQRDVEQATDAHYARAVEFSKVAKITPETFQAADRNVRKAIAEIYEGAADAVTDKLISKLGPGSEKVMYYLGINTKKREEFKAILRKEPDGFAALAFLKDVQHQVASPIKRPSQAPEPPDDVKGDKSNGSGTDKPHRDYKAAHKSGDLQKAIDIKLAAKAKGVDTSKW